MELRYNRHSKEFRDAIVTKILNRGERSISEICSEAGVKKSTATSWVQRCGMPKGMKKSSLDKFSPENVLRFVIESSSLSEEELGLYLRKEGLHSQQLVEFRSEVLESLKKKRKNASKKDERDVLIKNLEREVLRKDKALAEAAALLILQKKVNLILERDGGANW